MKKTILFFLLLTAISLTNAQSIKYSKYFTNERLRLDLYHSGNDTSEFYSIKEYIKEPIYGGPENTISEFLFGNYIIEMKDKNSGTIIFKKAYNTLFEEWQDTKDSKNNRQIFEETRIFPFPKSSVEILIYKRNKKLKTVQLESFTFNPKEDWYVTGLKQKAKHKLINDNGDSQENLDLVIIGDGYTKSEEGKFGKDASKLFDFFINTPPFDDFKDKINLYYVYAHSDESGSDLPGKGKWKNTALNSRFYSLGSERYLTTRSYHNLMDYMTDIPHDQIMIIVNTSKYGGGGIFNHYSTVCSDHRISGHVLTHEFGHSFGGLGDEYYTSSTPYAYHPELSEELSDPNLTTLVDFESKWKDMVHDTVPIPTPDTKDYENVVGVFEGGRYLEKGIYRPYRNCRMKSLAAPFCPVCKSILSEMLLYYTGKD